MAKDTQPVELTGSNPADSQSSAAVPWVVFNGTNYDRVRTARNQGDGWSGIGIPGSVPYLTNGNSYDRQYGNTQGTLLASAARTADTTSPDQTNYNAKGVLVTLRITAASGTGGLKLRILSKSAGGNVAFLNVAPTPITATGTYVFMLYPGATAATVTEAGANLAQVTPAAIPRTWYVQVQHVDGSSYTYSIDYALVL